MNLNELLERAKFYHPKAEITRLVKIGCRIAFYGGQGDVCQFVIDLNIDAPKVEVRNMVGDVRSNFIAELGTRETYDKNFPLIATLNLDGEQYQMPVSSISNFETWVKNVCPHYEFFKKPERWSILQTFQNTPKQYNGKQIFAIFLTKTAYEI